MLWPVAITCFEDRMNNFVYRGDGRTSYQALAGLKASPLNIKSFYMFGCPCYVLDNHLQSVQSMIPMCDLRARMGTYVGCSPAHTSTVCLIMNPWTRHILTPFHVVYDDGFTTVPHSCTGVVLPHWVELIHKSDQFSVASTKVDTWQSLALRGKEDDDNCSGECVQETNGTDTSDIPNCSNAV